MPRIPIKQPKEPWHECPRSEQCSVNACPLNRMYHYLSTINNAEDQEKIRSLYDEMVEHEQKIEELRDKIKNFKWSEDK